YQDDLLCKSILEKLVKINLINDRRYAERYAEYLVQKKGYGIYRAKQEMLKKGLAKDLIQEFLAEQETFAQENVYAVLVKKYGRILQDEQDFKTRNKVIAGMARLGYDITSIKYAIEDYFANQEDEESVL
ncbi:MAG: RecX family transcriptional regulator, partial [Oscillospiraceae bacterium]|nr:RecX family transcriptional regulator [Oscillospiraceae bacterium]